MAYANQSLADLDLNLLYTFQAFVQLGTVGATAKALGRSQPAISARLHQLQREMGADLFERVGRRLVLTPLGRSFQHQLQGILADIGELADRARAAQQEPSGTLHIGALPTAGVFLLAPRVAAIRRRFPRVMVELTYRIVAEQIDALRAGRLDLIVGVGSPPPDGTLAVAEIGRAHPVLVTPAPGVGRAPRPVSIEAARSLTWLGFGPIDDPFFNAVWDFLERTGLDRRVAVRVAHIQTLQALVASGAGATILPDYTVSDPSLTTQRIAGLDFSQPIWLATRAPSLDIPLVAAFRALLLPDPGSP